MADDVVVFVSQLIQRNLRYGEDTKHPAPGALEWSVDGQWQQAVPFVVPAD